MARYIDLDKVLEILENSLKFSKNELDEGAYRNGCIAAIKDDIGNISHMPTEDVVPRSEVEKAKQEVAREIFEEIDRYMLDGEIACKYPAKVMHPDKYAELKKKYIGE